MKWASKHNLYLDSFEPKGVGAPSALEDPGIHAVDHMSGPNLEWVESLEGERHMRWVHLDGNDHAVPTVGAFAISIGL
jgi:hypothetical protein